MAIGMMPMSWSVPIMVCVFPDAVWPYAKMVPAGVRQGGVNASTTIDSVHGRGDNVLANTKVDIAVVLPFMKNLI
jgi:hypothetical protein